MEENIYVDSLLERSLKIFQEIIKLTKTFDIMEVEEDDPIYQKYATLDTAGDHIYDGYAYLKRYKELM